MTGNCRVSHVEKEVENLAKRNKKKKKNVETREHTKANKTKRHDKC